ANEERTNEVDKNWPYTPSRRLISNLAAELWTRGILFQALPHGAHDAAVYEGLLSLGVRSFATDHPPVTLEAVRNYFAGADVGRALAVARDTRALLIERGA